MLGEHDMKKINYTALDFEKGITWITKLIKENVNATGKEYEYIVGIARGGAVPAVALSHSLGLPVQIIHHSTRDNAFPFGNKGALFEPLFQVLKDVTSGKNILLVDDIVDDGVTLSTIFDPYVYSLSSFENVDVATLILNPRQSKVNAKYFHWLSVENTWYEFFWEII